MSDNNGFQVNPRSSIEKSVSVSQYSGRFPFSKIWGYIAALALLPYATIKMIWAWGGTIGFTSEKAANEVLGSIELLKEQLPILYYLQSNGIDLTAILALIASLFALAYVLHFGLPNRFLIIAGWTVGFLTVIVSALAILQVIGVIPKGTTEGMKFLVFIITYGGFFVLGVAIFLATLSLLYMR